MENFQENSQSRSSEVDNSGGQGDRKRPEEETKWTTRKVVWSTVLLIVLAILVLVFVLSLSSVQDDSQPAIIENERQTGEEEQEEMEEEVEETGSLPDESFEGEEESQEEVIVLNGEFAVQGTVVSKDTSAMPVDGPAVFEIMDDDGRMLMVEIPSGETMCEANSSDYFQAEEGDEVEIFALFTDNIAEVCQNPEHYFRLI